LTQRLFALPDFATYVHYYHDLRATIPARYPLPAPLTLTQLERFLQQRALPAAVMWRVEGSAPSSEYRPGA
jgi:hypothetical protein